MPDAASRFHWIGHHRGKIDRSQRFRRLPAHAGDRLNATNSNIFLGDCFQPLFHLRQLLEPIDAEHARSVNRVGSAPGRFPPACQSRSNFSHFRGDFRPPLQSFLWAATIAHPCAVDGCGRKKWKHLFGHVPRLWPISRRARHPAKFFHLAFPQQFAMGVDLVTTGVPGFRAPRDLHASVGGQRTDRVLRSADALAEQSPILPGRPTCYPHDYSTVNKDGKSIDSSNRLRVARTRLNSASCTAFRCDLARMS